MVRLHGINGSWWSHHHELEKQTLFKPRMQTRINAHSSSWIFNQNDDLNWNQAWALPSLHTTYRNPRFSDHFTMRFDNSPALDPNCPPWSWLGLGSAFWSGWIMKYDFWLLLAQTEQALFGYNYTRKCDFAVKSFEFSQWRITKNKAPNNPATGTARPPSIFWSLGLFKSKPAVNVSHAQKPHLGRWIIGCGYVLQ